MGLYKDSLIVFGGYDGSRHNSIYSLHVPSNHWTLLLPAVGSSVPMPRSHHAMAIRGNYMYIFGGLSNEGKLLSDLHVFDLEKFCWKALSPGGVGPCARINHTGHILANFFVVFGGYDGKVRLNDIFVLNLDTGMWNEPLIHGTPPARRLGHAAVVAGDKLVIFGGDDGNKDQEMLSDVQIFDLPSMRWHSPELSAEGAPPRGRALASFCTTSEDVVWLIDGTTSQKARLDEIWRLDLGHLSLWKKMWIDRAAANILKDLTEVYRKIQVRSNLSSHLVTKSSSHAGMHRKRNSVAKIEKPAASPSSSSAASTAPMLGLSLHENEANTLGASSSSSNIASLAPPTIPTTSLALSISPPDNDEPSPLSSESTNFNHPTQTNNANLTATSSNSTLGPSKKGKRKTDRGELRERDREREREREKEYDSPMDDPGRSARSPKKRRQKTVSRSTSTKRESSPIPIATLSPTELSPTTSPRWREDLTFWMPEDDDAFESSVVTFADVLPHSPPVNNWGHFSSASNTTPSSAASTASNLDSSENINDEPEPIVLTRVRKTLAAIKHAFHELSLEKDDFLRLRQERLALIAEAGNRDTTQGQELKRLHQQQKSKVTLNVGGSLFTTSITTLCKYHDSMLATMFSGRHTLIAESDGTYFIDRDGTYFNYILNYLRCGDDVVLEARPSVLSELLSEARFYQLEGLKDAIQVILADPHLLEEPIVEY